MQSMIPRLKKFHLEIAPMKTKLFEFGKFAQLKAKSKDTKAATFNFLGACPRIEVLREIAGLSQFFH